MESDPETGEVSLPDVIPLAPDQSDVPIPDVKPLAPDQPSTDTPIERRAKAPYGRARPLAEATVAERPETPEAVLPAPRVEAHDQPFFPYIAVAGAALVVAAAWLPLFRGSSLVRLSGWYLLEPFGAALAVLGVTFLAIRGWSADRVAAVLLAAGSWGTLQWLAETQAGVGTCCIRSWGPFVGLAGGALIVTMGAILLASLAPGSARLTVHPVGVFLAAAGALAIVLSAWLPLIPGFIHGSTARVSVSLVHLNAWWLTEPLGVLVLTAFVILRPRRWPPIALAVLGTWGLLFYLRWALSLWLRGHFTLGIAGYLGCLGGVLILTAAPLQERRSPRPSS
jgi:hypothetical protein